MINRIRKEDEKYSYGYYDAIDPSSFILDENNPAKNGLTYDSNELQSKIADMDKIQMQNELLRVYKLMPEMNPIRSPIVQKYFDTAYGDSREEYAPITAYEVLVKKMKETEPYIVTYDFKKRFNSMVSIINGNQKAGIPYIRDATYKLVMKMIDADEENLATALDIEFEFGGYDG